MCRLTTANMSFSLTQCRDMQALRIWHGAIATLRSRIAQNACTAVAAAECGLAALDAVVAQYGCHPLAQVSELDRLLLSVDEDDAEKPQQSLAESPEQASTARVLRQRPESAMTTSAGLLSQPSVPCPRHCRAGVQALATWSSTYEDALGTVVADVRAALVQGSGTEGGVPLQRRLHVINEVCGGETTHSGSRGEAN